MGLFSGTGLTPGLKGVATNVVGLEPGQVSIITPAGWYYIKTGLYTNIQQYDPITQMWRSVGGTTPGGDVQYFYSDGVNYRLANQTGCVVGAIITNVGSGYTSAPTITTSLNGVYKAVVGGAVSQTVVVTNGGVNYTYPPLVQFAAPPAGGVQATGYCTLTSGAVSSVTMVDQGAGYSSAPTIVFVNDPREVTNPNLSAGSGATAVATLTGSGTITALLCLDHGNPIAFTAGSATSIPTLSFSGGGGSSAAATALMNWSITGLQSASYNNGTSGITGALALLMGVDQPPTANSTVLNVAVQRGLVKTRQGQVGYVPISGGTLGAYTTAVITDGGVYSGTPLLAFAMDQVTTPGSQVAALATMGYQASDTTYLTQL